MTQLGDGLDIDHKEGEVLRMTPAFWFAKLNKWCHPMK